MVPFVIDALDEALAAARVLDKVPDANRVEVRLAAPVTEWERDPDPEARRATLTTLQRLNHGGVRAEVRKVEVG